MTVKQLLISLAQITFIVFGLTILVERHAPLGLVPLMFGLDWRYGSDGVEL